MIAISKLCLFLSCLMLASSGLWEDWNNNLVVTSAPSAPLPSFWIRAKHTSIAAPMNERYNQYAIDYCHYKIGANTEVELKRVLIFEYDYKCE